MDTGQDATTRAQILATAAELFRGRTGASIRFTVGELARNLELHYTAIYHYFESKDHIVQELVEMACSRRSANLKRARKKRGTSLDQLLAFIRLELRESPTDLLVRPTLLLKSPCREKAEQAMQMTAREIEELISQGINDGSIRECAPRIVARLITTILNRYANQREPNLMGKGLTARKIAEQVVRLVQSGVVRAPSDFDEITGIEPIELPLLSMSPSRFDQMIRALTDAFNASGFDGTSIPRVAASIGVSKTSFYRYASTKDDLLYLCARHSVELTALVRRMSRVVATSPLQTLFYNVYLTRRMLTERPGPFLQPAHFHFLSEQHQLAVWELFAQTRENLREVIEEAIRAKEIKTFDAYAILPAIAICSLQQVKESQAGFSDEVARFLAMGLDSAQ